MAHTGTTNPDALVLERFEASVLHITLNRPSQFNALSDGMLEGLQAALDGAAARPEVRVVVIGGAGKAFCAGHDLKEMQSKPSEGYYQDLFDACSRLMLTLQCMPQPVIARVHGVAAAAGCQLVAMCDLAVAADDARFAVPGIKVGLFCGTPSVALARNVGRKTAFEMLVTGDFIDAATAERKGLINRVVPVGELDKAVEALAAAIVAKPRAAISAGKQLFYRQIETGIEEAYQQAGRTMVCNLLEEDTKEGIAAFMERRPPRWSLPTGD